MESRAVRFAPGSGSPPSGNQTLRLRGARRARFGLSTWAPVWMVAAVCVSFISPQAWGPLVDPAAIEAEVATASDPSWLAEALPAVRAWRAVRRTAHLPLWDASAMGGVALLPTSTFRPFYPGAWIHLVVTSADLAHRLEGMLHLFLAAALLSFIARREGFGRGPAGLAGLGWALCGPITTRLSPEALPVAEALVWMPLALAGAREAGRGQIRRGILYSGIACGLQLLTGGASVAVVTAYAWLGALISVRFWPGFGAISGPTFGATFGPDHSKQDASGQTARPARLLGAGLRASAGAACLALLLGAAMWLPRAEFAGAGNPRISDGSGVTAIDQQSRVESHQLFEWALPQSPTVGEGRSNYVGAGVLLFALLGMAWKSPARRGAIVAVVLAAIAWALASRGFGVLPDDVARLLPKWLSGLSGFGLIEDLSIFMAAGALGLIAAAAIGLEALIHPRHPPVMLLPPVPVSPESPEQASAENAPPGAQVAPPDPVAMAEERRARSLRARGSILLTAAVAGAGWAFYMTAKFSIMSESADWIAGAREAVVAQSRLAEGLMTVGIFAGFWAFWASLPFAARGRRVILGVLFALMAFFWALDPARNAGVPYLEQARAAQSDSRADQRENSDFASATEAEDASHRASLKLNLTRSDLERLRPLRAWNPGGYRLASWSRNGKEGESDQGGPSVSSHVDADLGLPASVGRCDRPEARNYTLLRDALGEANPNFIRLFSVGVLILPPQFEPGPEFASMIEGEFREVTSPEPGVRVLVRRAPVYIREVGRKLLLDSPAAILSELARPGYNVFEATLGLFSEDIPANATHIFHTFENRHSMDLDAEIVSADSGEVRIDYRAKLAGIVQIAEPMLPGWRAWVDGEEIRIGRSHRVADKGGAQVDDFMRQGGAESGDLYFLNAYLPSGSHKLRLDYDPDSVRLGIYMTLLGLAALAMAFGARARDFGWLSVSAAKPPPLPEPADAPRRIRELD